MAKKKKMWAFKVDPDLLDYLHDVKYWARQDSVTAMFEEGARLLVQRLEQEHNNGKPFPPRPQKDE